MVNPIEVNEIIDALRNIILYASGDGKEPLTMALLTDTCCVCIYSPAIVGPIAIPI
jgi:hypothetical protein